MSAHFADPERNLLSIPGPVGNNVLPDVGIAAALKDQAAGHLIVSSLSDGITQQGEEMEDSVKPLGAASRFSFLSTTTNSPSRSIRKERPSTQPKTQSYLASPPAMSTEPILTPARRSSKNRRKRFANITTPWRSCSIASGCASTPTRTTKTSTETPTKSTPPTGEIQSPSSGLASSKLDTPVPNFRPLRPRFASAWNKRPKRPLSSPLGKRPARSYPHKLPLQIPQARRTPLLRTRKPRRCPRH